MISRRVKSGFVGASYNSIHKHVLLQITESQEQLRVQLTTEQAETLINDLENAIKNLKNYDVAQQKPDTEI